MNVWIVYTELKPSEAFKNGAFVECYVKADKKKDAVKAAIESLSMEYQYEVKFIDQCFLYNVEDWDDENDPDREVRNAVQAVQKTGETHYGIFRYLETE